MFQNVLLLASHYIIIGILKPLLMGAEEAVGGSHEDGLLADLNSSIIVVTSDNIVAVLTISLVRAMLLLEFFLN